MRGIVIFTTNLLSLTLFAQTDYFPTDVGNQWIYRATAPGGPALWKLHITGTAEANSRRYAVLEGDFNGTRWLRKTDDGKLYAYDPEARAETLWYDFAAPVNQRWPTGADRCNPTAYIAARDFDYRGPIGEFSNTLKIGYPAAGCADAGLERDVILPGVGLVSRTHSSIAGPRTFELVYAKLGTSTYVSEAALSFGLALDRAVYYRANGGGSAPERAPVLTARLTLRNTTRDALVLQFPSGQTYDFVIRDPEDKDIYRWSADKSFIAVAREQPFSGEANWELTVPLQDANRQPLSPGAYVAEAWLTTTGRREFVSSARFEIRMEVQPAVP